MYITVLWDTVSFWLSIFSFLFFPSVFYFFLVPRVGTSSSICPLETWAGTIPPLPSSVKVQHIHNYTYTCYELWVFKVVWVHIIKFHKWPLDIKQLATCFCHCGVGVVKMSLKLFKKSWHHIYVHVWSHSHIRTCIYMHIMMSAFMYI